MPKYKCESELGSSGRKKGQKRLMKYDETSEKSELNNFKLSSNDNVDFFFFFDLLDSHYTFFLFFRLQITWLLILNATTA